MYVTAAGQDGWTVVTWDDKPNDFPPLPQHFRVKFLKTENGRDYFKSDEGRSPRRSGSVRRNGEKSYLTATRPPLKGPATLRFSLSKRQLFYGNKGPVKAFSTLEPIPVGTYDVEMPYEVHSQYGADYEGTGPGKSRYAKTWFLIGHDHVTKPRRYLHPGTISEGCITVDVDAWNDIYDYLILARAADGVSVGTIKVEA